VESGVQSLTESDPSRDALFGIFGVKTEESSLSFGLAMMFLVPSRETFKDELLVSLCCVSKAHK